jgi:hypothetical protein
MVIGLNLLRFYINCTNLWLTARSNVRELVWLEGDGTWNGGPILGATVYVLPKDRVGKTVYPMKMIEAKNIFERLKLEGKVLRIDHPMETPYLHFAVTRGERVGVFKGW